MPYAPAIVLRRLTDARHTRPGASMVPMPRAKPLRDGPLLELDWIRRQLELGAPVTEGVQTIRVDQIIGTATRARDFDGQWRPRSARLGKLLDDIAAAQPTGLDEPITVVRIDRAYFVIDGHKRVALAHRTQREFLDANVSHLPSPYVVEPAVSASAVIRTAREGEFRRHSKLIDAVPEARFALTDPDTYGELYAAVRLYGCEHPESSDVVEAARIWYDLDYLPAVAYARAQGVELIDRCTDADTYLAVHRQRLALWGTECTASECAADQALAKRRLESARRGSLRNLLLRRAGPPSEERLLLELTDAPSRAG